MTTDDALMAMASAYDWQDMSRIHGSFVRTYTYRWVDGHIVHPLSIAETERREQLSEAIYRFLTERYRREREETQ